MRAILRYASNIRQIHESIKPHIFNCANMYHI